MWERRHPRLAIGLPGAFVALVLAGTAHAATPAQILQTISAERAANGIPARLVEDPALSRACDAHNAYIAQQSGGFDPHSESPGRPGYTPEGAAVAKKSIIGIGANFDSGDPFQVAPFHFMRELDPGLKVTGAADSHGSTCVVTGDSRRRAARGAPRFYTLPGPGSTGVRREEFESEEPFTPGQLFGIPPFTPMGPHLYLFHFPGSEPLTIRHATMTGPAGTVPMRWVDYDPRSSAVPVASAVMFALQPAPAGVYCARVAVADGDLTLRHRWWFATEGTAAPGPPHGGCEPAPAARLRVGKPHVAHGRVSVVVATSAKARGRLKVTEYRGAASGRMRRAGTSVRGGLRRTTFKGRLPNALFIYLQVQATFRRTDGGSDASAYRNRKVGEAP
jgi:hypothetical protein